jgi:putative ABC transport system permease protein
MEISNYLLVFRRHLIKNRFQSLLKIGGLAIGTGSFIMLVLYVYNERSFDRFHHQPENLYRIVTQQKSTDETINTTLNSIPLGPALLEDLSAIDAMTRFRKGYRASAAVRVDDKEFYESRIFNADSSFFDVFTLPLQSGDEKTALKEPFSIVLTPEAAQKYFGSVDPLGKSLIINQKDNFKVTGVLKKIPRTTHLDFFDFLISFSTAAEKGINVTDWSILSVRTYVRFHPGTSPESVEKQMVDLTKKYLGDKMKEWNVVFTLSLQPVTSIHLQSKLEFELGVNNDEKTVQALGWVGIFILLMSCINYTNLTTAHALKRSREVSVRKVIGGSRSSLMGQFLFESFVIATLSVLIGFLLVALVARHTTSLIGYPMAVNQISAGIWVIGGISLIAIITTLSGLYPAFVLSKFNTSAVLSSTPTTSVGSSGLRRLLVMVQLTTSVLLLLGALVVFRQTQFLRNKDLGFSKQHLICVPFQGVRNNRFEAKKAKLLEHPSVVAATFVSSLPGDQHPKTGFLGEGFTYENMPYLFFLSTDFDFVETFGLSVQSGRSFSREFLSDSTEAYLINQSAAKLLNWSDPIGRKLSIDDEIDERVVGVINDYNFTSLRATVEPMVLMFDPASYRYLVIKVDPKNEDFSHVIKSIGKQWEQAFEHLPFDYFFLSEKIDRLYESEQRLSLFVLLFTSIAILSSAIGLLGLIAFNVQSKYKEMAIRKALGATPINVMYVLSREFFLIGVVSFAIASAVGYYFLNGWLSSFAYRIDIDWQYFLFTFGMLIFLLAVAIGYRCVKASTESPVFALRETS